MMRIILSSKMEITLFRLMMKMRMTSSKDTIYHYHKCYMNLSAVRLAKFIDNAEINILFLKIKKFI